MSRWGKWFGFARDEVFEEGMAAYDRGDFEAAVEAFQITLLESADRDEVRLARFYMAQALSELSSERIRAGDPRAGLTNLQEALRLYPTYPDLNLAAAKACRMLGRADLQAHYVDCAASLNPRCVEAVLFQGLTWYETGRHDEGLTRFEQALEMDPSLQGQRFEKAQERHNANDFEGAKRNLEVLALTSARDAALHLRIGDSFMRETRYDEAATEYQRALQVSPDHAEAQCRLGKALIAMGRHEQAEKHLHECLKSHPDLADAHAQLGVAYREMSKCTEAQQEFVAALKINPDHPVARKYAAHPA